MLPFLRLLAHHPSDGRADSYDTIVAFAIAFAGIAVIVWTGQRAARRGRPAEPERGPTPDRAGEGGSPPAD